MSSSKQAAEPRHVGLKLMLWVGVALWALTALTFGLSRLPHGPWSLPTALLIAAVKATLIALFFMHLVEQRGSQALVLGVSLFFVALLMGLSVLEVATRLQVTVPPGPFRPQLLPGQDSTPKVAPPQRDPTQGP